MMMMRGGVMATEQFVVDNNHNNNNNKAEEGDKEKKKKRRPNRRSNKHNSPSINNNNSVPVCNAVNGVVVEASGRLVNGNASNYVTVLTNAYSSQNGVNTPISNGRLVNGVVVEASGRLVNGNASNYVTVLTNTYSSQNGVNTPISNGQGSVRASDVAFSSLPTMRINDPVAEFPSIQDEPQLPSVTSKSCPDPIFQQGANVLFPNTEPPPEHKNEFNAENQRKCFVPHWSAQTVVEAIEKGDAFRASFRVNAHNRLEAYCTVDGIPVDILISGIATQNRAVEGDTVAIKLDPLALWTRLKGSAGNVNTSAPTDDHKMLHKVVEVVGKNCKGKEKLDPDIEGMCSKDGTTHEIWGLHQDRSSTGVHPELGFGYGNYKHGSEECHSSSPPNVGYAHSKENEGLSSAIEKVCDMISSYPLKRPTGRVVAIIERSLRRDAIVGFLGVKQWLSCRLGYKRETKKSNSSISFADREYIQLTPIDAKFPKMLVAVRSLPVSIKKRLDIGDGTLEKELVAARIEEWRDNSIPPHAQIINTLGRGGEIDSQIAAILFEHAICFTEFSPKSISCLPELPWDVPVEEMERRKDLRNLCTFTIDPSTATDLDDALSVQKVSDAIFRVGVHIADASYFVLPDSALDIEAQIRSTSVYLRQQKLRMLPSVLSENLGSLNPGADRLAFSIICDINSAGIVIDRWIGRTVIRSCCKLSYQHAQDIIDGLMDVENQNTFSSGCPKLHNQFEWKHIAESVKSLHVVSKRLRENRFKDGALSLGSSKLDFSFDECGIPLDSMFYEKKDSNSLVEEFMLLANRTVAEVISRAFPDSALLRRHPEPNLRKLREFEAFCRKHGLELDTSSSGQLHLSLTKLKEKLKNDPVLYDILISYASKPMQLAAYFCTGDFKDKKSDWAHYSLAVPFYTHFTSPLRRYPDIVVHRTLTAAIEAEDAYLRHCGMVRTENKGNVFMRRCFSGISFDENVAESKNCREALSAAALKHRVLCGELLTEVAAYSNKRNMASKHAEDSCSKLYLWALLKNKQTLIVEARVLTLGPKFMSIYIPKIAMERRIHYDEVDGMISEWLDATSTLVLSLSASKHSHRRGSHSRWRPLEDVALIINPCDLQQEHDVLEEGTDHVGLTELAGNNPGPMIVDELGISDELEPTFFPLTVRILSTINVVLHAIGGDDGPLDIGARLYMTSYLR